MQLKRLPNKDIHWSAKLVSQCSIGADPAPGDAVVNLQIELN
jgi:hypothetical protein